MILGKMLAGIFACKRGVMGSYHKVSRKSGMLSRQSRTLSRKCIAAGVVWLLSIGLAFAAPQQQPNGNASTQVAQSGPAGPSPESREARATEVIAIYTGRLAWLTGVLAVVGIVTSGLTLWQIRLARAEFLASNRPKLVVRNVIRDNGAEKFAFLLINKGKAACTVVESVIVLRANVDDVPIISDTEGINDIGRLRFDQGKARRIEVEPKSEGEEVGQTAFDLGFLESYKIRGVIIYEDDVGIRRRTVFTRILKKGKDVFERVDEPDADYAD
jgi:hypothetical protein